MRLTEQELRKAACQVDFIAKLNKAILKCGAYVEWPYVKSMTLENFMLTYASSGLRVNWNESADADDMQAPRFEDVPGLITYIVTRDGSSIIFEDATKQSKDFPR